MWERNIDWLPPVGALTRGQACSLGMCPDWRSNLQTFVILVDAPTNWATMRGLIMWTLKSRRWRQLRGRWSGAKRKSTEVRQEGRSWLLLTLKMEEEEHSQRIWLASSSWKQSPNRQPTSKEMGNSVPGVPTTVGNTWNNLPTNWMTLKADSCLEFLVKSLSSWRFDYSLWKKWSKQRLWLIKAGDKFVLF